MSRSTGSPDLVFNRYLVSQMFSDASCNGMSASLSAFNSNAMFIQRYPSCLDLSRPCSAHQHRADARQTSKMRCKKLPLRSEEHTAYCRENLDSSGTRCCAVGT